MTAQPLLERLITHYPSYCNFMGYFTHKSQPVKSLRTVSPRFFFRGPGGIAPGPSLTCAQVGAKVRGTTPKGPGPPPPEMTPILVAVGYVVAAATGAD